MANTAENVTAGKPMITGAVFVGAENATLPTSTDATLTGFTDLGFISDAGLVNTNTASVTSIKAWGGDTVLDITTEKPDTFKLAFLESKKAEVLKLVYGDDNVTGTLAEGMTIKANAKELPIKAMVIDMILSENDAKRIVLPKSRVTTVGDISYTDNDVVKYELTISAYPDGNGNTHYEYLKGATGATGATGETSEG